MNVSKLAAELSLLRGGRVRIDLEFGDDKVAAAVHDKIKEDILSGVLVLVFSEPVCEAVPAVEQEQTP